jgi:hypothetical protein
MSNTNGEILPVRARQLMMMPTSAAPQVAPPAEMPRKSTSLTFSE